MKNLHFIANWPSNGYNLITIETKTSVINQSAEFEKKCSYNFPFFHSQDAPLPKYVCEALDESNNDNNIQIVFFLLYEIYI